MNHKAYYNRSKDDGNKITDIAVVTKSKLNHLKSLPWINVIKVETVDEPTGQLFSLYASDFVGNPI